MGEWRYSSINSEPHHKVEVNKWSASCPMCFTSGERALVPKNSSAFENGYRIYEIYATKKPEFHLKYSKK